MKPSTITDVQVHRDELKFEENRRRKLSRLKKKIIDTLLKSAVSSIMIELPSFK